MKNQKRGELAICGREAVMAVARLQPDSIERFFFLPEHSREFGFLFARLAKARKAYRPVSANELVQLAGTVHHQGTVAMIRDLPLPAMDESLVRTWAGQPSRLVVLDHIGDDHNLGAIARSAVFFGWNAIIIGSETGTARPSTASYRVARGALSSIPVYQDQSAANFIQRCSGRITTIGADHRASVSIQSRASNWPRADQALAIVLGNEECGLSTAARKKCSTLARIDGGGRIESLNVSQAATIFLYEFGPEHLPIELPSPIRP
jgi:TrmH RNA methyltransferase